MRTVTCDRCGFTYPEDYFYHITDATNQSLQGRMSHVTKDGRYPHIDKVERVNHDLCEDCRRKLVKFLANEDGDVEPGVSEWKKTHIKRLLEKFAGEMLAWRTDSIAQRLKRLVPEYTEQIVKAGEARTVRDVDDYEIEFPRD